MWGRSSSMTATPSKWGITRSSRMRSGWNWVNSGNASRGSLVLCTVRYPSRLRMRASTSPLAGWSSTTRMPPAVSRSSRFLAVDSLGQVVVKDAEKLGHVQGLGEVVGCPRGEEPLDLSWRGVGADDHHRDAGGLRIEAKPVEDLTSSHVRQVEIQQDQVRVVLSGKLQTQPPLHRRQQVHRRPKGQDAFDELEVRQIVLDV